MIDKFYSLLAILLGLFLAAVNYAIHRIASTLILPGPLFEPKHYPTDPLPVTNPPITQHLLEGGLVAWEWPPRLSDRPPTPTILFNFGNAMSLDTDGLKLATHIQTVHPYSPVIMWDYGGIGRSCNSGGGPSHIEADARRILSLTQQRDIVCWGHSLGSWAASVMAATAGTRCKKLVLSATFSNLANVSILAQMLGFGFCSPEEQVQRLAPTTLLTVVQATDDLLFPMRHVDYLLRAAPLKEDRTEKFTTVGGHNSPTTIAIAIRQLLPVLE